MNTTLTYKISELWCITFIPMKREIWGDENNIDELIAFNWEKDVIR